jgi:23S rRNA (uracil1939-C5)-methyltransferase
MARTAVPLSNTHTARVDDLNQEGWGVVRAGKTVFVAGALPGERVEYVIRRRQRHHDEGELIRVLEASPERVVPGCEHFGVCGGCSLQHLDSAAQLRIKDGNLRETLRRIGKVEPREWLPPLSGQAWGYRRRARLGARFVHAKGRSLVGFRERLSSFVADIRHCHVLVPQVGEMIGALSALLTGLSIPTRIPQIEVAVGDNQVVLVMRTLDRLGDEDRQKLIDFESRHGVRWLLQPGGPASVEPVQGETPQLWYGLPEFDLKLSFEPQDFIQINGALNQRLIAHVLEQMQIEQSSRVLDLYCGLGNFTLPLARRAQQVLGIEGDAGLIERAGRNALANGLGNVHFRVGNLAGEEAAERCLMLASQDGPYTHVLLDPPRTGACDILPAIARVAPQRLVYVSCHPGSLARDLSILVMEHGFTLQSAGIVDMFPHTSHVESVAVLDGPAGARQ